MIKQSHSWVNDQRTIKSVYWRDICTSMFIAELLTIAKKWKQPKCPWWMDKENVVYIFSHKKVKNYHLWWINQHYAEWNKPDTEGQIQHDCARVKSKKFELIEAENRMVITGDLGYVRIEEILEEGYTLQLGRRERLKHGGHSS